MNREEIEAFITANMPFLVKSSRTGKFRSPCRSLEAHNQVIQCLTDAFVKNNVDLESANDWVKGSEDAPHDGVYLCEGGAWIKVHIAEKCR